MIGRHYEYPVRPEVVVRCFGLANLERRQVGGLSAGQRRRVGVALAFCGAPRLIVLDEPTAALDGEARRLVWGAIRAHARRGGTVLLTTHQLDEAEALADRVVLLDARHRRRRRLDRPDQGGRGATRVSFRAPSGTEIEGAVREGARLTLVTPDGGATVTALVRAGVPLEELEVRRLTLEEALAAGGRHL